MCQAMQPHGEFRTIHAGRILLRLEEAALLERAGLAILALGDIEDDSMSVKLRRGMGHHRLNTKEN